MLLLFSVAVQRCLQKRWKSQRRDTDSCAFSQFSACHFTGLLSFDFARSPQASVNPRRAVQFSAQTWAKSARCCLLVSVRLLLICFYPGVCMVDHFCIQPESYKVVFWIFKESITRALAENKGVKRASLTDALFRYPQHKHIHFIWLDVYLMSNKTPFSPLWCTFSKQTLIKKKARSFTDDFVEQESVG